MVAFRRSNPMCAGKRIWTDGAQSGPCLGQAEQRAVRAKSRVQSWPNSCAGGGQAPPGVHWPLQPSGLAWVTCMSSAFQQPCGGGRPGTAASVLSLLSSAKGGRTAEGWQTVTATGPRAQSPGPGTRGTHC